MMIKVFLISAFIAFSANAEWVWKDTDGEATNNRFPRNTAAFAAIPNFPNFPNFPSIPTFPNFPNIPNIASFANFQNIPDFQKLFPKNLFSHEFPDIKITTPENIMSHTDKNYHGMAVTSRSDGTFDIYTNNGGKVQKYKGSPSKDGQSTIVLTTTKN